MASDEISARMAEIAREVQSGEDVGQVGDRICRAAVELLGPHTESGISIAQRGRRVDTIGATSVAAQRGDELQVELWEGPCLDAAWEHEQVVASDLAREDRWPQWGPRMVADHGIKSMLCTQLFTNDRQLGALNVYSTEHDAFDDEAQEMARVLAVHAAMAVASAQQIDGLRLANDRRTAIGKALGIIMVKYDLQDDLAFAVLQRLSSHENRKLFDIAQDVVAARGLPGQPQR
ncbi:GAF domain-containing protein [Nocardioides sp. dk4132]|uniref:GAF and ANTAR domain-containing protein n=1 Tax=unclassified Nocardioides TaxID=2615069 RepID=UPI00129722A7|nr:MULTISPECIES: GAF and ANTAR domain-containing protein [unclassified Nocardioides]MQW77841.1 GAF domain-containing protein [Nocardioides sp. dk4132]QGA08232.1 GAF domain-containing protein [Nocardioides sp. dk884]